MDNNLLKMTASGLFCPMANVFIDPWRPVEKALITHAHSDHSRWGMHAYLAHHHSREVMKLRLGEDISLQTVNYKEKISINGVSISFHPAGHIPGSSQIRLEYKGRVAVVSGDYKLEADGLSEPFEPVKCHEFVSECTFGLPIYRWESQRKVFDQINSWWQDNAAYKRNSVLFAYSLGKAQRILNHLDPSIGNIFAHGAIWNTNQALLANQVQVLDVPKVSQEIPKSSYQGAMIIAPPSAMGTPWLKKFAPFRTGVCSGWMNVRGARRRRAVDRGFVLSDHADWDGLITAVKATSAEKVYLTHGNTAVFAKYLEEEEHINAVEIETLFQGENNHLEDN
ncbi:ligase-associated DNA damage response exonuclease [Cecembia lonarensis]|uniref:Putative exonuclease of the beta-lactamase fold involved in RNA processing n=1 Tax=Cecembia lonarensis (strain CCUG 58316 / KCTC 22772 / LW9) TaxID=1225176 RepID=K1LXB1_CECL9|nr:ligase-associated DNA damage response exonuclease [Cecembia lonarensis]EKB48799.1 putative exonuclease of the beta-lactamase fold involved in RNA processing [Cecembia lonarensis LW9]